MRTLITLLVFLSLSFSAQAATDASDLPDIGSPSDSLLTSEEEEQIGHMIMEQLRMGGQLLNDPEVEEYINNVGHRLSANANAGRQEFTFFIVDDHRINAFALPGGYIGVNSGLILATDNESELAGVLAHEIAHVTQNHIERGLADAQRASLAATAAILAAVIVGATTDVGTDVITGTVLATEGAAIQQIINFTRENEKEADRVGINTLAESGFDPLGMPSLFRKLGAGTAAPNSFPEFLRTHPSSSARVAESYSRASKLPAVENEDSINYQLVRERLRVAGFKSATEAVNYYRDTASREPGQKPVAWVYGSALALLRSGQADQAADMFRELLVESSNDNIIAFYAAYGQALMADRREAESLAVFEKAMELFPRNVPLTVRYTQALLAAGQPDKAHVVLLDLLNIVAPTADQARLIAVAASEAGDLANAHYYLAEYYVLNGLLPQAIEQLNLALRQPGIDTVQRARFAARRSELNDFLPEGLREETPWGETRDDGDPN